MAPRTPRDLAPPAVGKPFDEERRFRFGANWSRFLELLTEERIQEAELSLRDMLGAESLSGCSFLDVGSGSGLFSLVARRLGARVHSFDFDSESVECTKELRRRYYPDDPGWQVEQGSVLDEGYVKSLGKFDVVYSWGVLHHTGQMWRALDLAAQSVAPNGGRLFIAIYNKQAWLPRTIHITVKRTYSRSPSVVKHGLVGGYFAFSAVRCLAADVLQRRSPLARYRNYQSARGMSWWHDTVDWVGGYPYEYAAPDEIFDFYRKRGFALDRLKTVGAECGCNEFVFKLEGDE